MRSILIRFESSNKKEHHRPIEPNIPKTTTKIFKVLLVAIITLDITNSVKLTKYNVSCGIKNSNAKNG